MRSLALLNMERGTHSTGLMDHTGAYYKDNTRASEYLQKQQINQWIAEKQNGIALCGHTRMASRGAHTVENAHPFRYGMVTGMHNGVIDAPFTYNVDSEYAFDLLATAEPGDYQGALGKVAGWYVLVWHDVRDGMLYFLNWQGSLHFAKAHGSFYYSSDAKHLKAALGWVDTFSVDHGQVYRFDGKKLKQLKSFTGQKRETKVVTYPRYYAGDDVMYGSEYQSRYSHKYTGDLRLQRKDNLWYAELRGRSWDFELMPNQEELHKRFPGALAGLAANVQATWRKLTGREVEAMFEAAKAKPKPDDDTVLEPSEVALTPSQLEAEMRKAQLESDRAAADDVMAAFRAKRRAELEADGYMESAIERQLELEGLYESIIIT